MAKITKLPTSTEPFRPRIENDIPIPLHPRKGPRRKYPELYELKVGQSIWYRNKTSPQLHTLTLHLRQAGQRFVTRREADGIRIWRIK